MLDRACSLSLSLSLSPSFARRGLSTTDLVGEHPKPGYRASSGVTIDPCHLRSVVFMQSAMPRAFRRDTAISRWRRDSAREGEREKERERERERETVSAKLARSRIGKSMINLITNAGDRKDQFQRSKIRVHASPDLFFDSLSLQSRNARA
jgi:hypothetical protein